MVEPTEPATRVVVASDFFLTREGLACLLAGVPGIEVIEVIERVDSHPATLEAARRDQPDVIVVGIRAGRAATGNTLDAARRLRTEHSGVWHRGHRARGRPRRPRAVLAEMAKGHRNRVIAENLSISVNAVESQATSIFRKLRTTDHKRVDRRVAAVIAYLETFGP